MVPKGIVHCLLDLAFQTVRGLNEQITFSTQKLLEGHYLLRPKQTAFDMTKDHHTDRKRPGTMFGLQQS